MSHIKHVYMERYRETQNTHSSPAQSNSPSLALWLALYTICLAPCEAIWFPDWPSSHHCFLLRLCFPKINFLQGEKAWCWFPSFGPYKPSGLVIIQPGYQENGLLLHSFSFSILLTSGCSCCAVSNGTDLRSGFLRLKACL